MSLVDEGLASAMRTIAGARPEMRAIVFENMSKEVLSIANRAGFNEQQVVERLQQQAVSTGLVEQVGEDVVIEMLGRAKLGVKRQGKGRAEPSTSHPVATPFAWKDPATIPRRQWLYGSHLIRKFASATIAHPGIGKSALVLTEALALACGRDLLGTKPRQRCRVWYWNGEDPQEETDRRIAAASIHFGIGRDDLEGWLFSNSGRDQEIVIARQARDGAVVAEPVVDALIKTIQANAIDVLTIDPFISSHRVLENDNGSIDVVVKRWTAIAERANIAIELVHHSKKTGGGEVAVEDGRGAIALLAAVRSARVLNGMTKGEGEKHGLVAHRTYFRVDNGKANLAPPPEGASWFHIRSVPLGNGEPGNVADMGDSVGVVTAWTLPDPMDGVTAHDFEKAAHAIRSGKWRESVQSGDWVGVPIANALHLSLSSPVDKAKVKAMLRAWLTSGALQVVEGLDGKRMPRKFVEATDVD